MYVFSLILKNIREEKKKRKKREKFGNGITAWGGDGHFEVIHFYSNEKFIIDIVRP